MCSRSIAIGPSKNKWKRLYSSGCVVSRGMLERLAGEDAKRLAEIKGPHAFLCHVCEGKPNMKSSSGLSELRFNALLQSALRLNPQER